MRQLVELEIIDHGARATVVMTNTDFPEEGSAVYRDGWESAFDNLDLALAG